MRTISFNEVSIFNRNLAETELKKLKPYVLHLIDSELKSLTNDEVVDQFVKTMETARQSGQSALGSLTALHQRIATKSRLQVARETLTIGLDASNKSRAAFHLLEDEDGKFAPDHLKDNGVLEKIGKMCTEHLSSKLIVPAINSDGKIVTHQILKFEVEKSKLFVNYLDCGPLNGFDVALSDLEAHYPQIKAAESSTTLSRMPKYEPN